jgi:hypothetical protein
MRGGRVVELEAVNRQAGLITDPEGAIVDGLVDVGGGVGDVLPASRSPTTDDTPAVSSERPARSRRCV